MIESRPSWHHRWWQVIKEQTKGDESFHKHVLSVARRRCFLIHAVSYSDKSAVRHSSCSFSVRLIYKLPTNQSVVVHVILVGTCRSSHDEVLTAAMANSTLEGPDPSQLNFLVARGGAEHAHVLLFCIHLSDQEG